MEEKLIFIVSLPRSGSTYLQRLLSNNDQVNTVSEPWIQLALSPVIKPKLVEAKYDYSSAYGAFNDYLSKTSQKESFFYLYKNLILESYVPLSGHYNFIIRGVGF